MILLWLLVVLALLLGTAGFCLGLAALAEARGVSEAQSRHIRDTRVRSDLDALRRGEPLPPVPPNGMPFGMPSTGTTAGAGQARERVLPRPGRHGHR